ncbi:MAG: hypothetical protein C4293_06145 [Nitrospiraceae bacterium]
MLTEKFLNDWFYNREGLRFAVFEGFGEIVYVAFHEHCEMVLPLTLGGLPIVINCRFHRVTSWNLSIIANAVPGLFPLIETVADVLLNSWA